MDLINIYHGTNNIKPKVLLQHFLRTIGFYVEHIMGEFHARKSEAVAEVYIIDNNYVDEYGTQINYEDDKSILIFSDEWSLKDLLLRAKAVSYDEMNEKKFLVDFIDALDEIMEGKISCERLIHSDLQWKETVTSVADAYIKHDIMPVTQYTRCFHAQDNLYHMALRNYVQFINELRDLSQDNDSSLLKYILLYAQFELNRICKQNNYEYYVSNSKLLLFCEQLISKFNTNEELCLLRADILFELQDDWLEAWKYYQVKPVRHCSYVYYKCGRIARLYLSDYDNAIPLLKRAIEMKPDYYQAIYQLASCYEMTGEYEASIECFLQISEVCKKKYRYHLLAPIELEYLYKSYIKVALINQNRLGNNLAAYEYSEMAERIKKEAEDTTFLGQVWPAMLKKDALLKEIKEEMCKHMNAQIQKMF